ncbi:hypothetical protein EJB05_16909 [Eragrostis curvula]|uniref:Cyanobacterial aminoacyl-tRNA synthetase CAAD domain-containing protein n=1 Tax=Eragrostis curvula TaxID=38414 RepID=A0A5J9VFI6_9POAL|nr:hypothetical protein EJB05_16909 [Eragrostis curvula]
MRQEEPPRPTPTAAVSQIRSRSAGKARSRSVVAKVARDSSEPSSGSIVKYVKSSFDTPEDIFALAGLGFAAVAALWASVHLIEVIDKLPVLPLLFELIGIVVAWLFIYNNLLFKPDRCYNKNSDMIYTKREEFLKNIKSSVSRILGQ